MFPTISSQMKRPGLRPCDHLIQWINKLPLASERDDFSTHMILVGHESFMEKHPSEIPQYFNKWRSNEKWNLQESSVLMDESGRWLEKNTTTLCRSVINNQPTTQPRSISLAKVCQKLTLGCPHPLSVVPTCRTALDRTTSVPGLWME